LPSQQLLAGTSGYSFKEWCGPFYPETLPADAMLGYYAERLTTVEINNTFYRMPAEDVFARWANAVPKHFFFALKAPRRITHEKRLLNAVPDAIEFLRRATTLEDRLGAVLFQLPPTLKKDLPRLRDFLAQMPAGPRMVFEFRHDSWQSEDIYEALHGHGATLCVTDTDEGCTPFVTTSGHSYLRLRRSCYTDVDLKTWIDQLGAQAPTHVYVYFMHEDEAKGTRYAQRMMALWRTRPSQ